MPCLFCIAEAEGFERGWGRGNGRSPHASFTQSIRASWGASRGEGREPLGSRERAVILWRRRDVRLLPLPQTETVLCVQKFFDILAT